MLHVSTLHAGHSPTKLIENSVAQARNGSVLQLFRTGVGFLYQSTSHDEGRTWSLPRSSGLPNPNSKAFLSANSHGDLVLAYNPTSKGRNPLALAISTDEGKSFKEYCDLDPGVHGKALEYPTTVQVGVCRMPCRIQLPGRTWPGLWPWPQSRLWPPNPGLRAGWWSAAHYLFSGPLHRHQALDH